MQALAAGVRRELRLRSRLRQTVVRARRQLSLSLERVPTGALLCDMSAHATRMSFALALATAGAGIWYVGRRTAAGVPADEVRARAPVADSRAPQLSVGADGLTANRAGPVKLRPEVLGHTQPDVSERRRTLPDDFSFAEHLKPTPEWTGPTPRSLADVPATPHTKAKLAQFRHQSALNHHLGLLARLNDCLGNSVTSRGGVFAEFWFNVNPTTREARPDRVAMLESSLSEDDDRIVIGCLEKAHAGSSFIFEPSWVEENPGETTWVLRSVISVPVKNDRLYRALLDPSFK